MTQSRPRASVAGPEPFFMTLDPPHDALTGWRVTVFADGKAIARATENDEYVASTVGVNLYRRWLAGRAE